MRSQSRKTSAALLVLLSAALGPGRAHAQSTLVLGTSGELSARANDESGVTVVAGEVRRQDRAAGLGPWTATAALPAAVTDAAVVSHAGRLYQLGGTSGGAPGSAVRIAEVQADGTLGAWSDGPALPGPRTGHAAAVYDGHVYVAGGSDGSLRGEVFVATVGADGSLGGWAGTTALPTARTDLALAAFAGRLYALGGSDGVPLAEVLTAPVRGDGTLGPWTAATALPAPVAHHAAAVWNGRLYAVAGEGASPSSAVHVAEVADDGSLGSWRAVRGLPATRARHAAVALGGHLYVLGGWSDATAQTLRDDALVAPLRPDGGLGPWRSAGPLPGARRDLAAVGAAGRVYALGGSDGAELDTVLVAERVAEGAVAAWEDGTGLSGTRLFHETVVAGDRLYLLGGCETSSCSVLYDEVYVAEVADDGSLGAWTATTPFATARRWHVSLSSGRHVYVIGGRGASLLDDVQYAPVAADGTLGAWTTSAQRLPSGRRGHGGALHGGHVYVVGGELSTGATDEVLFAALQPDGDVGPFAATTPLPEPLFRVAVVATAEHLYVLGGQGSASYLDVAYRAPINADGTLGAWTATTPLPAPLRSHEAVAYAGRVYVFGGFDAGGTLPVAWAAPVNADGSLGSWSALRTLPNGLAGHGASVVDGTVFLVGGAGNSSGTWTGRLNVRGTLSGWSADTPLPAARHNHEGAAWNGHVYALGGFDGAGARTDEVTFAPVGPDGALGGWAATTPFSGARAQPGVVAHAGHLYVSGGLGGSGRYDDVQYAPINTDGTVGPWTATSSFTTARNEHALVAHGGRLYVIGGDSGSGTLSDVQYAPVQADGSLGPFVSTAAYGEARTDAAVAVYGDHMYVLGGYNFTPTAVWRRDVRVGTVQADGSLAGWTDATPLPLGLTSAAAWARDGVLYVAGGAAETVPRRLVLAASIRADGSLGPWYEVESLDTGRTGFAFAVAGDRAYAMGGSTASGRTATVERAAFDTPAAVGRYSRSIDLQTVVASVDTVTLGGAGAGSLRLGWRTAGADGVFGPAVDAGFVEAGTPVAVNASAVRWIRLDVQLDDRSVADAADTVLGAFGNLALGYTLEEPTQLAITSAPHTVTAGACSGEVVIEARDPTGYPSPPPADLPLQLGADSATLAFFTDAACSTPAANLTLPAGATQARFHFSDPSAGGPTVTVTDPAAALAPATQGQTVVPGPAAALRFVVQPAGGTAGLSLAPAVEVAVEDALGNVVTSAADPVVLSLGANPGADVLAGTLSVLPVAGVAAFPDLVLDAAALGYTLEARAGALPAVESAPFDVAPAPADHLAFTAQPGPAESGLALAPPVEVTIFDAFGNAVTGAAGPVAVALSVNPSGAVLSGTASVAPAGGVAAFADLAVDRAGAGYTLTASWGALPPVESAPFDVAPRPDHLFLSADSPVAAGADAAVQVQAYEASGVPAATVVHLSLEVDGSARFASTGAPRVDLITDAAGAASATVTGSVPETVTVRVLSATRPDATPLPAVTPHGTAQVVVEAGPPDHVTLTGPAQVVAGAPADLLLQVVDAFGNPVAQQLELCLTAAGQGGGAPTPEAGTLGSPSWPDAATVCGLTGAAGDASLPVTDAVAETVTATATSVGLPGSGTRDGVHSWTVAPAAPDALVLLPDDGAARACATERISLAAVDAFGNPVELGAATVEVTLTAVASAGSPQITATDLLQATTLPAASVTGVLPPSGAAFAEVGLDAAGTLELSWTSAALPAGTGAPAAVDFALGGLDVAASTVQSDTPTLEAGRGFARITVTPRDACGLPLGAGYAVAVSATGGDLGAVSDLGDGSYEAELSAASCPQTIDVSATVDGAALDAVARVEVTCVAVDPASPAQVTTGPVEACLAEGAYAILRVDPLDDQGLPLPPGQAVTVEADPPRLVVGRVTELAVAGGAAYEIELGSDRCGGPYPVNVRVDGVALSAQPQIEFLCPPVDAAAVTFVAEPAEVAADGESAARVTVSALDRCGNPAFGRAVTLTPAAERAFVVASPETVTADLPGEAADGAATFALTSRRPGEAAAVATVDGVEAASAPGLVTFLLDEVLTVQAAASTETAVVGQRVTVSVTLTSAAEVPLTDLRLELSAGSLELLEVVGAPPDDEGRPTLDRLEPGASAEVELRLLVRPPVGSTRLQPAVSYGAEGARDGDRRRAAGPELSLRVVGSASPQGCACDAAGSGAPAGWALSGLIGLALVVRRRRSAGLRRRSRPGA